MYCQGNRKMALYFDREMQPAPGQAVATVSYTDVQWHAEHPILAVASKDEQRDADGTVRFYSDEGDLIDGAVLQRSVAVECVAWHPTVQVLAAGWRSGEIAFYDHNTRGYSEQSSMHKAPVSCLRWNTSGRRLISCDKDGLIALWPVDQKGGVHGLPAHHFRLRSAITHCVLHTSKSMASDDSSAALFCATSDGAIHHVDGRHPKEAYRTVGPLLSLLFSSERQYLVVVTQGMDLCQVAVNPNGEATEMMKVRLGGRATSAVLVRPELLAYCCNDSVIRFWDFDRDENYTVDVSRVNQITSGETVTCIHTDRDRGVLAAGTSGGHVVMWQYQSLPSVVLSSPSSHGDPSPQWDHLATTSLQGALVQVQWSRATGRLAVNASQSVHVLSQEVLSSHYNEQVCAVQTSPSEVKVEYLRDTSTVLTLKTDIHIQALKCCKHYVALWGGGKMVVYSVVPDKESITTVGTFDCESSTFLLHEQTLFTLDRDHIQARTLQGTVKQVLSFVGEDGHPLVVDLASHYLVAISDVGLIKLWDISRREAKQQTAVKLPSPLLEKLGDVSSIRCSCDGSRVSLLTRKGGQRTSLLVVVTVESGEVVYYDFDSGVCCRPLSEGCTFEPLVESAEREQWRLGKEVGGTLPEIHHWDSVDPKLLVVELHPSERSVRLERKKRALQELASPLRRKHSLLRSEREGRKKDGVLFAPGYVQKRLVVTFFATPEYGLLIHQVCTMEPQWSALLAISTPNLYFTKKSINSPTGSQASLSEMGSPVPHTVDAVPLGDFRGFASHDQAALKALLSFSYNATVGNMDEAFRAIKAVRSQKVWENLARMCVRTERPDVATVCLSNMGNAIAAKAAREAKAVPEVEARLGIVAAHLNMLEEAETYFRKSKRYDLLIQFYQAMGKWNKAIEVAELHDRLHLKTAYHLFGKYSEAVGEMNAAISSYEKAETHRTEVPRMLLEDPAQLEDYVLRSKDKSIRKWWAEYMESLGEMEAALQFYEAAKDYFSVVRVLCFIGNIQKAVEVVEDTGDKAAAYHLARRLESEQDHTQAVRFYSQAQCYSSAIRLAKEVGLEPELMNLALLSTPRDMLDAASYFEGSPDTVDRAIILYHKAGELSHALELCFQTQQFDTLQRLVGDLNSTSNPEMVLKCATFFAEHGQFPKAVELLVKGRKFHEALELSMAQNIPVTEELADRMTEEKAAKDDAVPTEERTQLLEKIADVCMYQGNYHLAAKKFTQAGSRIKAMKALLKSGDTERIVFFAQVSRQKDIYIMAANYLQSLDWRGNPEVMKNIITYYTKGKALESLAAFYDSCAQVEIDDYQNYTKALGALKEAHKCLAKAKAKKQDVEDKMGFLQDRIQLVDRFATARRLYEEDPQESVRQCTALLDEPNLDTAVRTGDVFGLLIEHYSHTSNYQQAYSLMEEMRRRMPSVNMAFYVDMKTIETVHQVLGIPLGSGMGGAAQEDEGDSDLEESVGEVEDD